MRLKLATLILALATATIVPAIAADMPKSVVHVITFKFKEGITDEQKTEVWKATETLAKAYPGISHVWIKALKVQGPDENFKHSIVMEFKDQAAFDAYKNDPAHKAWEKVYLQYRGESRTHDITN